MVPTQNKTTTPVQQPSTFIIQPPVQVSTPTPPPKVDPVSPPPQIPPTPSVLLRAPQDSSMRIVVIILVLICIIAAVLSFVLSKKGSSATPGAFNDTALRVKHVSLPATSDNSAEAFIGVAESISQNDVTKIYDFILNSTPTNLPPIRESKALLASYPDLTKAFDAYAGKPYECNSLFTGRVCPLGTVRDASYVGALRSLVYLQEGKVVEAQKTAQTSVDFGRHITNHATDIATLLVGWISQRVGYISLAVVNTKTKAAPFSAEEKKVLIDKLRTEHKTVLKHMYSNAAFGIDQIDAPNDSTLPTLTPGEKESFEVYRKARIENPSAWDVNATKKYFYDSIEKMLKNVDMPCGATLEESILDIGYDQKNPQSENFIGKTLYVTGFASLDNLNERRCEVESVISKL